MIAEALIVLAIGSVIALGLYIIIDMHRTQRAADKRAAPYLTSLRTPAEDAAGRTS